MEPADSDREVPSSLAQRAVCTPLPRPEGDLAELERIHNWFEMRLQLTVHA